jgi:hypothetical protein
MVRATPRKASDPKAAKEIGEQCAPLSFARYARGARDE